MKKLLALTFTALLCFGLTGCPPIQESARDGIAASVGAIFVVQQKHKDSCQADPSQEKCILINKAVDASNLALDALNLYCSGSEYLAGGPCQPNKEIEPRLREALKNLERIMKEVKGL